MRHKTTRRCPTCGEPLRVGKVWHPTAKITMRTYGCRKCGERKDTQEVEIERKA